MTDSSNAPQAGEYFPAEELAQVPVPVAYQAWEVSNGFVDNLRFLYERARA